MVWRWKSNVVSDGLQNVVPAISTRPFRTGSVLGKDISAV